MEKPDKGLAALNQKLKPGGYINIGLYSEIAREDITKARNHIKEYRLGNSPEDIREFRNQVFSGKFKEISDLKMRNDFYSLSPCRDLCFHVQEHLFNTDLLDNFLKAEGLIFCGFLLPSDVTDNYKNYFPRDADMISLTNRGEYEKKYPSTFKSMYQFWAYKPFKIN